MHVFNNQILFLERESEKLDLKTLVKKKNKLQSVLAKFFWNIEFNMWDPPGKHWIYLNSTLKTLILGFRLATESRLMGRRHLYTSL